MKSKVFQLKKIRTTLKSLKGYLGAILKGRETKVQPGQFIQFRANLVLGFFLAFFVLLVIRAISIHLFPPSSENLTRIAYQQYRRKLSLSRYRGTIFDRRGQPLAISIRKSSVFVNPRIFAPSPKEIYKLAHILRIPSSYVRKVMTKKNYFAWLKRKISRSAAEKIEAMNLKGLYQVLEPARYYPAGNAAANLLGYVGIDDQGLFGIERQFEKSLSGPSVLNIQSRDAHGKIIFFESEAAAPEKAGDNIHLTIDRAIQEISESALKKGVKEAKAKGGFAIVSDPHTRRILAVANYPTFDPNNTKYIKMSKTKNRALLDVFEPGSVIKPFVVATALALHKTTVDEKHDCEKGIYRIGRRFIRDSHKPETQYLTTTETVVHSSNVCAFKIAEKVGPQKLYEGLHAFGFGQRLFNLNFPGEPAGRISNWANWKPIRFANIAFGQGLLTTGLELVQAYGAIANGGKLMKPYYIDRIESYNGAVKHSSSSTIIRRVLSPKLARTMRNILGQVVQYSTSKAKIQDFSTGGKTGTSQKIDKETKRYSHSKHLAGFTGIAPLSDPHLVIYVQIDEPKTKLHYGALWAAPVFKEIAEKTLHYLNVAPDKKNENKRIATKEANHGTSTRQ